MWTQTHPKEGPRAARKGRSGPIEGHGHPRGPPIKKNVRNDPPKTPQKND